MRCRTARLLINRGLREPLTGPDALRLDGHLAACHGCCVEQEQLRRTESLVERSRSVLQAPALPFPVDFTRRLHEQDALGKRLTLPALAVPACVGAVAITLLFLPRAEHPTSRSTPPVMVRLTGKKPVASVHPGVPVRLASGTPRPRRREQARPPVQAVPARMPVEIPDERYLNGELDSLQAVWAGPLHRGALPSAAPETEREFITVTVPPLATADPSGAAAAVREQQKRAQLVDPRLQREVTLHLKAASLEELCAELKEQTRVDLSATAGVRDEKVTVLVKDMPARNVLRAVARLFGYVWARSGEDGGYRYALTQTLSDRLAEEELRNRDTRAALLALDAQLAGFAPLAGLNREELKRRLAGASPEQKARIELLLTGVGWGGMQVYSNLAPRDLAQLRTGHTVQFGVRGGQADYQLPTPWKQPLMEGMRMRLAGSEGYFDPTEKPEAYPVIGLKLNRSELGRLSLESNAYIFWRGDQGVDQGVGLTRVLATAQSPSVAAPHNAELNRALRSQTAFARTVSIRPKPSCPRSGPRTPEALAALTAEARMRVLAAEEREAQDPQDEDVPAPHVTTADVWEAVHQATGMPVVADSYMRLYPQAQTVQERTSVFEALNGLGDTLGLRWKQDGGVLLGRSTSYFWDKLKEVPNRSLKRWREDVQREGGLPLDDLLSMSGAPDEQLDSAVVGQVMRHCRDLSEWSLLTAPQNSTRGLARMLASLPPGILESTLTEKGLPCSELPRPAQRQLADLAPSELLSAISAEAVRLRVTYAPSGWTVWSGQLVGAGSNEYLGNLPLALGKTPEAALASALRLDPRATPDQLSTTSGFLCVQLLRPNAPPLEWGRPNATFTLPPLP
jgi:hypothetical protein